MQLTVLLFLVSHQFFCHQISFCYNFSELQSTSSEKDFCHKFYFFNEFTQITHPLNSQNLLSVTKVPTTDSLVSFSEHISRTAILTKASVITCKQDFQSFSCIGFTCLAFSISFFKDESEKRLASTSYGFIIEFSRNEKLQKQRIILSQHTNYLHK